MDDRSPVSDRLRHLASRFEASVSHGRAEQLAARAVVRARRVPRRHHRAAAAVVGSAFTIVVLSGLAVAAESAVPGDFLYPVDRAVEALGLDRNLLEERLEEAIVLADRGDRERVFQMAGEVLAEVDRAGVEVRRAAPTNPPDDTSEGLALALESGSSTTVSTEEAPTTTGRVAPASTDGQVAPVDDLVLIIRLEAENLLRTVRQAKIDPAAADDVGVAAGSLADAIDAASVTTTSSTSSTTTTVSPSISSSSTTTTVVDSPSTTSTTVEGNGGGDDDSEPGGGDGSGSDQPPITLPQP